MTMEPTQLRNIIEGALLAAGQPLNLNRLKALFEEDEMPETDDLKVALEAIAADCEGRGFELKEVGSGWRFQVKVDVAPWINRLWEEKPQKYSRALLETLALVAYRQPITRGDIEEIRGVAVSSHIIRTLSEREWIKVVGHRDVPGRPSLYATTRQFLDYFNLKSLEELPSLGEIRDLDDFNTALDLDVGSDNDESESNDSHEVAEQENGTPPTDADENQSSDEEQSDGQEGVPEEPSEDDRPQVSELDDELPEPDQESEIDPDSEAEPVAEDDAHNTEHYAGSLFDSDETNDADAEVRPNPEADQSSL